MSFCTRAHRNQGTLQTEAGRSANANLRAPAPQGGPSRDLCLRETPPALPPEQPDPPRPLARSPCGPPPPPRTVPQPRGWPSCRARRATVTGLGPGGPSPWRAWALPLPRHHGGPAAPRRATASPASSPPLPPPPPLGWVGANADQARGTCEQGPRPNRPWPGQGPPAAALSPHRGARGANPGFPHSPLGACLPASRPARPGSAPQRPPPGPAPLRSAGATCRSCGRPPPGPAGCRWPSPRRSPPPPRAGT